MKAGDQRASRRALNRIDTDDPRPDRTRRASRRGTDPDRRARIGPRGRRVLVGALVALVMLVGVWFVAGAPINTYRSQRTANAEADADLAEVRAERVRVRQATERLESDAEVERRAREKFGYQRPDEEAYNLLPAPVEPTGLPDAWPFTGVERVLGG